MIASTAITPQVGQLLYQEHTSPSDGSFLFAQLLFVDTPVEEGKQLFFTSIAHMEDFGNGEGMIVETAFNAGGMPNHDLQIATNDHIVRFIALILKDTEDDVIELADWLKEASRAEGLLDSEQTRLHNLAVQQVLATYGEGGENRFLNYLND